MSNILTINLHKKKAAGVPAAFFRKASLPYLVQDQLFSNRETNLSNPFLAPTISKKHSKLFDA